MGFLLCWLKNIYSSTYRYRLYHGATFLRNINEVYSASAFLFIFSYRAGRDTEYQHSRKPLPLAAIFQQLHMRPNIFEEQIFFATTRITIPEESGTGAS